MNEQAIADMCTKFMDQLGLPGLLMFAYADGDNQVQLIKTNKGINTKAELQILVAALEQAITKLEQ